MGLIELIAKVLVRWIRLLIFKKSWRVREFLDKKLINVALSFTKGKTKVEFARYTCDKGGI